ncbi:hypothetical protein Patl1_05017 [Pistacia atlantica]|uniref:Uncharacterized protein n=1 Tax=Pistacia atlantica TaxID=434234 RepID=A0ACC1BPS1_9ROSI|nr:hypothetical protein Patl1_05017 [Pistacia atlantica]
MSNIIPAPKSKSRKKKIVKDGCEGEDIISKLPDNILHYILSFLPTQYVLRTSVLSKRWMCLWTSISIINFDENDYFNDNTWLRYMPENVEASFLNSVDRVLNRHDPTCIQKFRLVAMLCVIISTSRIHSWVSTALSHKVQELDLSLPAESVYMFPNSLFSAESLSTLKLKTYSKLEVPSLIHFPNLKTLHLAVEFPDDRSAQQIFSGCPVLQEFAFNKLQLEAY